MHRTFPADGLDRSADKRGEHSDGRMVRLSAVFGICAEFAVFLGFADIVICDSRSVFGAVRARKDSAEYELNSSWKYVITGNEEMLAFEGKSAIECMFRLSIKVFGAASFPSVGVSKFEFT